MTSKVYWPDGYYDLRLCDEHSKQSTISMEPLRDTAYCEMCQYNNNDNLPRMSVDQYIKCWSAIRELCGKLHGRYTGHDWHNYTRGEYKGCLYLGNIKCDATMWIREDKKAYVVMVRQGNNKTLRKVVSKCT